MAVTVDPAGKFLFVANSVSSDVSVFSIAANTGVLSQVTGSPFPTGAGMDISGIAVSPDGKTVYVSNFVEQHLCLVRRRLGHAHAGYRLSFPRGF